MNRKLFIKHLIALLTLGVFMTEPGSATTGPAPASLPGVSGDYPALVWQCNPGRW
jgi:hypothetical protein